MELKKPTAVILAGAFAANCAGAGYGITPFTDLPPIAAVVPSSATASVASIHSAIIYTTVTDELIETHTPEKDRSAQS